MSEEKLLSELRQEQSAFGLRKFGLGLADTSTNSWKRSAQGGKKRRDEDRKLFSDGIPNHPRASKVAGPTRVFVSYSWDSKEHERRVGGFATLLCNHGMDVRMLRWDNIGFAELGAENWLKVQIYAADFVLVMCSAEYTRKCEAKDPK